MLIQEASAELCTLKAFDLIGKALGFWFCMTAVSSSHVAHGNLANKVSKLWYSSWCPAGQSRLGVLVTVRVLAGLSGAGAD